MERFNRRTAHRILHSSGSHEWPTKRRILVSILSCTVSVKYEQEHEHDDHITSRLQTTQQRVGASPQSHPGLCDTPVGPGKPARGKAVGGPTTSHDRRRHLRTGTRHTLSRLSLRINNRSHCHLDIIHIMNFLFELPFSHSTFWTLRFEFDTVEPSSFELYFFELHRFQQLSV